ncbi:hypothetical protein Tco_0577455, partial [Tanacetum coccineum]
GDIGAAGGDCEAGWGEESSESGGEDLRPDGAAGIRDGSNEDPCAGNVVAGDGVTVAASQSLANKRDKS